MKKPLIKTMAAVSATALLITSCSSPSDKDNAAATSSAAATSEAHEHDHEGEGAHSHDGMEAEEGELEVAQLPTRVVITYDGGIKTIDAKTGEEIDSTDVPGFLRLSSAGDGRYAMVTQGDKFLAYDSGLIKKPHGDHNHYYTAQPKLTDVKIDAPHAGHVVNHDELTALFSDGDGVAKVFKTSEIGTGAKPVATFESGAGHHGVAVPLKDGSVVMTKGTEDERHTVQHRDKDGKVLAETTECPGVHGEAAAGNGKIFFGCEDGPVVFDGKEFHKIDVSAYAGKGGYQRSGNSAGSEESNIILADNKTEKDADFERPTSVSLINTEDYSAKKVELGSSYWFRSLARGPLGEALVLTYDGNLNIIDPETGEVTKKIAAISEWKENEEWQLPGPILKSEDGYAFVTDANKKELVVIDLFKGEVAHRYELDYQPVEMAVL